MTNFDSYLCLLTLELLKFRSCSAMQREFNFTFTSNRATSFLLSNPTLNRSTLTANCIARNAGRAGLILIDVWRNSFADRQTAF